METATLAAMLADAIYYRTDDLNDLVENARGDEILSDDIELVAGKLDEYIATADQLFPEQDAYLHGACRDAESALSEYRKATVA